MDDDDFIHDPFTSNHLWRPSGFFEDPSEYDSSLFKPVQLDVPSIKFDHPYAPKDLLEKELQLPDLDSFEFGPLPELDSFEESSISIVTPPVELEEDVWQAASDEGPANKDVNFFTWEAFENHGHGQNQTPYLSESGAEAFDAALARDEGKAETGRVLKNDIYLESLWNLGLGRSSILFKFNHKLRTFEPAVTDGRPSGVSLRTAQAVTAWFILTGNSFLWLRSFVERTFASSDFIPARVALATSVSSILSTFEDHLGRHVKHVQSLLQLQRLFSKPQEILLHVGRMVDAVKHAKNNEQLSSILHHRVLNVEEGDAYIRQLSSEIMSRVSRPSLELLAEWIGIRKEQETVPIAERGSFVMMEDVPDSQVSEYLYNPGMMARFISPEDGNTIFETGNSLRFLKLHHPEHPLASLDKFGVEPPELEWKFGWQDIEAIASKAKDYEHSLRTAILDFSDGKSTTPNPTTHSTMNPGDESGTEFQKYLDETTKMFDGPPTQPLGTLPDELQSLTEDLLEGKLNSEANTFSPPISLTSTLSFRPLLTAQAKLVNATTLRLFFRSHHLRMHLSLQRQYQLLGDGVFSSRLASALFSPEHESAEHQKGRMRSGVHMGLQLGTRSSWPPASSELRLALMGVLSESYFSSELHHNYKSFSSAAKSALSPDKAELPGQLNFAVRQLSEPEMERIMDPHALYALDFLRLQYVPPSPLNLVLTPSSLTKYDTIFKFLLRLLRIVFVVSHLPRAYANPTATLFRIEAHHFVTALSTYIFQSGIAAHWDAFTVFVDKVEEGLAEEDGKGELGSRVRYGIAALREAHDKCLDSIMFSLLLRNRQRKVMGLVEEIFGVILVFARVQVEEEKGRGENRELESVAELYAKLRGKVRVFVSVCRGLTGKKGYGKGRGTAEENTLERLGVLLEMNGYFG
ncbi:hypothetical protein BS50DRAFT_518713 [Corynespora cassiicola Philippines]|uniref:Spindle pole body component n=1 Tax=Corynespora cassiicola Philippines TaxID=1448308 RepID=A0A2T2P1J5_CORCC|nr:hypothetical protein BS50DRAFT_518713 [Corynespora cassiicola Philippines]